MSAILKQKLIDIANGFTKYGLWKGGGSGGSSALSDMTDVTFTDLQANNILKYNGSVWVNGDNLHEYSTEEKIVGKWLDGRNVYEKTLEITSFTNGDSLVDHGIENIDVITSRVVDGYYLVFGSVPIPTNCFYNTSAYTTTYVENKEKIHLILGNVWSCTKVLVILQYCKLTTNYKRDV